MSERPNLGYDPAPVPHRPGSYGFWWFLLLLAAAGAATWYFWMR